VLATGGATGFTAEVPYSSDVTALESMMMPDVEGAIGTALIQVFTDDRHPVLGSGAVIILKLPVTFEPDAAAHVAMELNALEASWASSVPMRGAWCQDPSDANSIAFVSFVPSLLAAPGVLENFVIYDAARARWVHGVLSE
jgi:hypothetical protein